MAALGVLVLSPLIMLMAQTDCPVQGDFGNLPPQTVVTRHLKVGTDFWSTVEDTVRRWYQRELMAASKASARLAPDVGWVVDNLDQVSSGPSQLAPIGAQHTCYLAKTAGPVDYRVALQIVARGRKGGLVQLEVRWLGQAKGRRERTWGAESLEASKSVQRLIAALKAL